MSMLLLLNHRNASAAPAFAPTDIAGLQLWLKADSLSLNDADPVGTWADQSGNARDCTQATAANKPIYKVNIQNGLPCVRFDGTDDYLTGGNILDLQAMSWFICAKLGGNPAAQDSLSLCARSSGGATAQFELRHTFVSLTTMELTSKVGTTFETRVSQAATALTSAFIWTGSDDLTNLTQGMNGASAGAVAWTTAGARTSEAVNFLVGGRKSSAPELFFNGDIFELGFYNTALSAGDITSLKTYLATKYNITVS
jgi:hypothetical protein